MAQPSTTGKKRSCPRKPARRGSVATNKQASPPSLEPDKSKHPFAPLCQLLTSLPHVIEASASARPVGGLLAESLEHEAFKGYPLLALRRSLGGRGDEALILLSMRLSACTGAFTTLALITSVVQMLSHDGLEIGIRPVSSRQGELLFCIDFFVPQGGAYPHRLEIASSELMSALAQASKSASPQRRTLSAKRPPAPRVALRSKGEAKPA